jgi:hypothetical protein
MDDVIVEHVHPFWNKTNSDKIYSENKQRAVRDKENYHKWIDTEGPIVVKNLKKQGF